MDKLTNSMVAKTILAGAIFAGLVIAFAVVWTAPAASHQHETFPFGGTAGFVCKDPDMLEWILQAPDVPTMNVRAVIAAEGEKCVIVPRPLRIRIDGFLLHLDSPVLGPVDLYGITDAGGDHWVTLYEEDKPKEGGGA